MPRPRTEALPPLMTVAAPGSALASSTNGALVQATAAVEVEDSGWPVVVVRTGNDAEAAKPSRLLFGLDRVLARGEPFGLVFDLDAAPSVAALVDAALAHRAGTMTARCVGAATVRGHRAPARCLGEHPVLFPFPSTLVPSFGEAVAWIHRRLFDAAGAPSPRGAPAQQIYCHD
jgi:hypothetical protein